MPSEQERPQPEPKDEVVDLGLGENRKVDPKSSASERSAMRRFFEDWESFYETDLPALANPLVQQWVEHHLPTTQIEVATATAERVFGDRQKGIAWLSRANFGLNRKAPIELLGDEEGYQRVLSLLGRIEAGTLA